MKCPACTSRATTERFERTELGDRGVGAQIGQGQTGTAARLTEGPGIEDGCCGRYAVKPPSIVKLAPVTKPASGPAR